MSATSQYFGAASIRAFERVGDIMLPRDGRFPSFGELGVIAHIDEIAEHIPDEDRGALNTLLAVLSIFPTPLLRGFVALITRGTKWPGGAGTLCRMLDVALRSVIVTLYFSGKRGPGYQGETPLDLIGYHVNAVR